MLYLCTLILNKQMFCTNTSAMKNFTLSFIMFILSASYAFAQTFNATIAIDDVDISNLSPGDDVIIPVRQEYMEPDGGLLGIDLYIEFDHTILTWKGTNANPLPGVTNFNPVMSYSPADWYFFDDSIAVYANWICPTFCWVNIPDGEQFFDFIFTYNGGLGSPDSSYITFQEQTSMVSQYFDLFVLSFNNGSIYTTNQTGNPELKDNSIRMWSYEQNICVSVPETTIGNIVVYSILGQEVIISDIEPGLNVIMVNKVNAYFIVKVITRNNAVTEKLYIR